MRAPILPGFSFLVGLVVLGNEGGDDFRESSMAAASSSVFLSSQETLILRVDVTVRYIFPAILFFLKVFGRFNV